MSAFSTTLSAATSAAAPARRIVHRTRGHQHGPITRLMSPSDLGELLKPFVFLDLIDTNASSLRGFGLHPHSGIATLTCLMQGSVGYEDTDGATGRLVQGGLEWMVAGAAAGTAAARVIPGACAAFSCAVALPPELEAGPAQSIYLAPGVIQQDGPARVLLGHYGAASSKIQAPSAMNYLSVQLKAGERWRYQPPQGHTVGWVALSAGGLRVPEMLRAGELAVFEASDRAIDFHAEADTEFVLGSAVKHPHELVLGNYSVHTSRDALRAGEANIQRLATRLRGDGRLR